LIFLDGFVDASSIYRIASDEIKRIEMTDPAHGDDANKKAEKSKYGAVANDYHIPERY